MELRNEEKEEKTDFEVHYIHNSMQEPVDNKRYSDTFSQKRASLYMSPREFFGSICYQKFTKLHHARQSKEICAH